MLFNCNKQQSVVFDVHLLVFPDKTKLHKLIFLIC
jgi:hypothetical protein